MKLFRLPWGIVLQHQQVNYLINLEWDTLINRGGLYTYLSGILPELTIINEQEVLGALNKLLPPIGAQEVWAAGVTYLRSREARMEESADSGAADL